MKTPLPSTAMFRNAVIALTLMTATQPLAVLRAQQASVITAGSVAAESENSSSHRGLTVHGHWIIDVKDKDGKVVEHRDFENSLVPTGSTSLALLLTGQLVYSSAFAIALKDTNSAQLYQLYSTSYPVAPCSTDGQSTISGVVVRCVSGLTQTYPPCIYSQQSSCTTSSGIVLQGSFIAAAPLAVDTVQTLNNVCTYSTLFDANPSVPQTALGTDPQTCEVATTALPSGVVRTQLGFTATTVTTLNVAAGQSLLVKVILGFS